MAPVPDQLSVLLEGQVIGTLTPVAGGRVYRLRYLEDWAENSEAYPVSLALPLTAPEHAGLAVRNWLRGLLPDNEARLQEVEAEYGVSRDDPFAVLANIGEDCVGAVQFATAERAAEIVAGRATSHVEWLDEKTLEALLQQVAARTPADRRAVRTGQFSLPGALGKVALVWDPEGERWGLPSGQWASSHIFKPPMPGVPFHNENEHYCLRLAEAAGLSAARSRVMRFGTQQAIVVERYDRRRESGARLGRIHQEDMAQALGLDPLLKYAAEGGAGIPEIVRLLRDYARPMDVDAFVKDVAFVWITGTTDAHLRNYSILIRAGLDVGLAPLYDVASALGLPRPRKKAPLNMAMSIGGTTSLFEVDGLAWKREFQRSRLPARLLSDLIDLAHQIEQRAETVADALVGEGQDETYLSRLAKSIRARARGCAEIVSRVT
jgi:serine/threonine-protein kinase HipA